MSAKTWGGGVAKVINSYEGDHFNEITFKGRLAKFHCV